MKLIYIYGMPAVGKLTVAKELEKMTGFKLFHNHLTADYVSELFPERNQVSDKIKEKIACTMFEEAAKHDLNIIFTMTHEDRFDDFVKQIMNIISKHKGEILFVRLYCDESKLHDRITQESRKKFLKATTHKELKEILKRINNFKTIPFKESLEIDNTDLEPKECAQIIKEYYKL